MAKSKEILMYIGGKPKTKEKKERSDWEVKWDKIVSGEGTLQELGDTFSVGDVKKLQSSGK
ncbi:MAG: hypothetical protein AB7U85_06950 [Alphaproteobacteria bacterium]